MVSFSVAQGSHLFFTVMFLLPSYLEKREMYVPRKTLGREIIFRKEGLVLGREVDWSEGGPEGGLAIRAVPT